MTPDQWRYWAAEVAEARKSADTDTFSDLTVAVDAIVQAARAYVWALRTTYSQCQARLAGDALDNAEAALIEAVGGIDATD